MKIIKDGQGYNQLTPIADSGGLGISSTSNALDINLASSEVSIGGGTEFAEGTTHAIVTGSAIFGETTSNVFMPLQLDGSNLLKVAIADDTYGVGGGINYTAGDTSALVTGTAIMWDNSGTVRTAGTSYPLPVTGTFDVNGSSVTVTGSTVTVGNPGDIGGGIQFAAGDSSALVTGTALMWDSAGTIRQASTAYPLPVTGTFSVDGSTIAVTGGTGATESTLTTLSNTTSTISGHVDGIETTLTSIDGKDFATQTTLATLSTEATLNTLSNTTSTMSNTLSTVSGHLDGIEGLLGGTLTVDANSSVVTVGNPGAIGGGIQYTAGDTSALVTGTALMWDSSGTLRQASTTYPLPVTGTFNVNDSTIAVTGGTIIATATNLDIRDLAATTDFVTVSGTTLTAIQSALEGTLTADLGTIGGIATEATLATISGHVDGIETLLGTMDVDTSSMNTDLGTLAAAVAGGQYQVDVVSMPSTTVTATNLDVRDLAATTDFVSVSGATLTAIQAAVEGTLTVSGTATVSATNLDIRDLAATTDFVTVSGAGLSAIETSLEAWSTPLAATSQVTTSGLTSTDADVVAAPGAGNHLEVYQLKANNVGGGIEFELMNGSAGDVLGHYFLAYSGGGFNEPQSVPVSLSSNTALYYNYINNTYNPSVYVTAHYRVVAD